MNTDTKTNNTVPIVTDPGIEPIKLKLPVFWLKSPAAWFIQAEAQLSLARISSDISRYNHVLTSLPEDIIESIIDFIQSPPANNLYEGIKALLIERHSMSEERRIEQLLSNEQMGDRRPSEFYRAIKQLAGTSGTIGAKLITNLWARRLPQAINIAIIAQGDKPDSELTALADRIWEASHRPTISETDSQPSIVSLQAEISELKTMLSRLSLNRGRSRQRQYSRPNSTVRTSNRSNSRKNSDVCWYHTRYANKAKKCNKPCSFSVQTKN